MAKPEESFGAPAQPEAAKKNPEQMDFGAMVEPSDAYKESFLAALRSLRVPYLKKGEQKIDRAWVNKITLDGVELDANDPDQLEAHFSAFVDSLKAKVDDEGRKVIFWAVDQEGKYIGYVNVWGKLTDARRKAGGQLSIEVRPEARGGKNQAKWTDLPVIKMTEWSLAKLKEYGNDEIMYSCSEENARGESAGLRRLGYAVRDGGTFLNEFQKKMKQIFWVATTKQERV